MTALQRLVRTYCAIIMISMRVTSLPFFPATRVGLTMTICLPFMTEMVFGLATNVRIDYSRSGTIAFAILGIFEQPQLAAQLKRVRSLFIPSIKFAKDYSGKSRWPRFKAGMVLMSTSTAISIFSWVAAPFAYQTMPSTRSPASVLPRSMQASGRRSSPQHPHFFFGLHLMQGPRQGYGQVRQAA